MNKELKKSLIHEFIENNLNNYPSYRIFIEESDGDDFIVSSWDNIENLIRDKQIKYEFVSFEIHIKPELYDGGYTPIIGGEIRGGFYIFNNINDYLLVKLSM